MQSSENRILLEGVTKKYGKQKALDTIHLTVEEGMFGLLGHNGAGKTTLMKLLTTLTEPDGGTIRINGYDAVKNKLAVRNIVGFLPQEFNIYPQLTAREFLDYIARLNQIKGAKQRKKLTDALLEKVNLSDVRDKKVGGFSGGMKRRLGIAQALVKDPKILIVDEPTAGLDPEERIRFRTMLVELSRQKVVILSTHIVEDISASCEQIGLLDKGQLKYIGSPLDFVNTVDGKVWEISTRNREDLIEIKDKYPIISIKQTSEGMKARIVGQDILIGHTLQKAEPNLEDAYIYYMENMHRGERIAK